MRATASSVFTDASLNCVFWKSNTFWPNASRPLTKSTVIRKASSQVATMRALMARRAVVIVSRAAFIPRPSSPPKMLDAGTRTSSKKTCETPPALLSISSRGLDTVTPLVPLTGAVRSLAGARGHDQHGHDGAVGHPHLLTIDDVIAAGSLRIGLHAARIAAAMRLGDADLRNRLARRELRQPFMLLRFRAGVINGVGRGVRR